MKKILSLFILFHAFFLTDLYALELADFKFGAASVLPFYTKDHINFKFISGSVLPFFIKNQIKYVILSSEQRGNNPGTYDDFSGSRDPGEDHPILTAAREFHEEAMLEGTTGLSLEETINYIDIDQTGNTEYIIAYTTPSNKGRVIYIVDFNEYAEALINNFYSALKKHISDHYAAIDTLINDFRSATTDMSSMHHSKTLDHIITFTDAIANQPFWHYTEKESIATVEWEAFKEAIINQPIDNATVSACVIDPTTQEPHTKEINLRPVLVERLKPFFSDAPYEHGDNEKMRFYPA
jgi:hypothetical protein